MLVCAVGKTLLASAETRMPRLNFPPERHFREPLSQRVDVVRGGVADECGLRCPLHRLDEILIRLRRRRPSLTLILRADLGAAVRVFRRTGQSQQAELPDL